MSAPYVASGERVDHTKRANCDTGRSRREEREGPMPDPVVRIRTRGKRMERERTPALGWDLIQKRIWTPWCGFSAVAACVRWMTERVQSPASDMTILAPVKGVVVEVEWVGNVAKGCHSRSGLDDMDRQENL